MNQRIPKMFAVTLMAAGTILAGCSRDTGPDLKAEVDQLKTQLADLQGKLAAADQSAASGKEELTAATASTEEGRRALAAKEQSIAQKDEQVRALQSELSTLKKSGAVVFGDIGAIREKGSSGTAFERYQKFVADFPDSPLVPDANRAIAELKPTVEKEAKWKTSLIDPRREERELLKRFSDGVVTVQELAPLLRRRTSAEVITLLGRPGRSFRNGTEIGYVDKIIDTSTGNKETLVIRFDGDRVESLRTGYQGREIKP